MIALYIIVMIILVFFSMCFSSADMAYSAVSTVRLENYIKEKNSKVAKLALDLTKNYEMTIATLLLGNNLVNIGLTSIMTIFLIQLVNSNVLNLTQSVATTLGSLLVLVILLICGEIVPKSIVKSKTFRACLLFAYFTKFFSIIFFPFVFIFSGLGKAISYPITKNVRDIKLTDKELEEMVDSLNEEKIIDVNQAEILKGTIDYASTEAYEIMTPRVDVYALDINSDLDEILSNEDTFLHSRIPVYEGSIDNIVGFVLSKTLIRMKIEGIRNDIRSIILPILNFPRSIEINDIFKEFKRTKTHLAVILDEYGGTEGIITLEDILEEIVGEIWDETDDKENPIIEQKDGTYIVDGKMNLDDFFTEFNLDKEDLLSTEYVTIGGFCIELSDNEFCKVNDVIKYKNLTLKVLAVDNKNTIEKLHVTVSKDSED